eukprot:scpid87404/ scgid6929/ 
MANRILFALLLAAACGLSNAWWRCHECIEYVTVDIQVTSGRFAGTDNEARSPHFVDLIFFCEKPLLQNHTITSMYQEHVANSMPSRYGNASYPGHPVMVGYDTVHMEIPMHGVIIKGQSRTFNARITPEVKAVCGECVAPINLRAASVQAGHSDGIDVKTVSMYANYKDLAAGLLTIDQEFEHGFLDTTSFPDKDSQKYLPLTKAGC